MSSQAYGRNDERIITKRKFHGEFPNHPSITPIHVGAIGKDTAPFNQSHNHIPAPPHAPDFSPTGMTNPNVMNYSPAYNGQYHPPNSYPHSAMPVPYNHFLPNNPTATNLYPPHPPQMWGGVIPHTTAPYTFVQQPTKPMAPLVVPKVSQKTSDDKNTTPPPPKSAIRKEPHQSQKTPSHAILQTKSTTQNKPHSTATGGEPITNDDTTQNPARAAAPATTTQSDKNNDEEGKASIQGEESKVKPSDESLPSQSVEKKAKENKKIKETKNKPPPVSLPPIVVAEVIPSEEKIDKSSVAFAYEIGNKKSENCANAAESKWKSQQSLVTPSPQKKKKTTTTITSMAPLLPSSPPSPKKRNIPVEVFYGPAPELPPGWILQKLQRTGGKSKGGIDRYWYSPARKRFRSTIELKKYMTALGMTNGDEEQAYKLFKKGGITI